MFNQNNFIFQHYGYVQDIPNIATVNKELKKYFNKTEYLTYHYYQRDTSYLR